jgi:hypothetical protein
MMLRLEDAGSKIGRSEEIDQVRQGLESENV